jgi:hypothetical protein
MTADVLKCWCVEMLKMCWCLMTVLAYCQANFLPPKQPLFQANFLPKYPFFGKFWKFLESPETWRIDMLWELLEAGTEAKYLLEAW